VSGLFKVIGKQSNFLVESEVLRFLGVSELLYVVIELILEVRVFLNVLYKDFLIIR
jgi:hypothetical protein